MCEFVRFLFPEKFRRIFGGVKTSGACGSPRAIVLCASAIRAVDVARLLRGVAGTSASAADAKGSKGSSCIVAKLFSKHLKLEEQVAFLQSQRCPLAVATPARLLKLLEPEGQGALKLDALNYLIIDGSYRDKKDQSIMTLPELRADLQRLISLLPESAHVCTF